MLPVAVFLAMLALTNAFESKIVGGSSATIETYPYQVSIHYGGVLKCGGSIISPNWVLTAAHCVYGENPAAFQIRIQSTYNNKGGTLISGIKKIIWPDDYDDTTFEFDVALIQLPSPIKESSTAKSIPLAKNDVPTGSQAVVTGWGMTSENGKMSDTLQVLKVPVVDQTTCKKIYASQQPLTNEMLCAGSMAGGRDTCRGDSGGPLVYNGVQIGIVSWGYECARPNYPGVYTRVSAPAVRSWITKQANV